MYVSILPAYICDYMHAQWPGGPLDPLNLELQMVVSHHVGASNSGPLKEQVLLTTEPKVDKKIKWD